VARATDSRPDGRYSWFLVAVGTLAMVFTFGTPYSYGVFLGPFGALYGLSSVTLSTVFSVELFLFYAGAGVIGVLASRLPTRGVLLGCGLLTGLLAPALYVVDSYAGLAVVFGLLGAALGTVFVVLASIVPQWFEERRGIATGVLFAGAGVSLFVVPPAWQFAFGQVGVRGGFLALCLASAVAFLVVGAFGRRPPWASPTSGSFSDLRAWLAELVGSRRFRLLFVGVGLAFAWYYVLASFAIDLFQARGLSPGEASVAFGLIGGVSVLSRLAAGAVADRVGYRETLVVGLGCTGLGTISLAFSSLYALGLAVFCYGIGLGAIASLYIPVLMSVFDPARDTAIVGVFNVAFGIFALLAPPIGTALVAATGSFDAVIALTGATTVVSTTAIWVGTGS